jgi:hypothetical protein
MRLAEASKNRKQIKCIKCAQFPGLDGFISLSFLFEDESDLSFCVDENTDELI